MRLQLIRNATLLLDYSGRRILIDPYFAPRHSLPSYTGKSPNPLVDLTLSPDEILDGVELVVVSHLHSDHFDTVAQDILPKALPILCQLGDDASIREFGFSDVTPVADSIDWQGVSVTRTEGHHGEGQVEAEMGEVSGFVFQGVGEPMVYWAGDTILCDEVRETIESHKPDVIVTHSSGATWPDSGGRPSLIVMDAAQTVELCRLAPGSTVIAVHMDSLDHGTVSRSDLRAHARREGITGGQLCIPADGEVIEITPE